MMTSQLSPEAFLLLSASPPDTFPSTTESNMKSADPSVSCCCHRSQATKPSNDIKIRRGILGPGYIPKVVDALRLFRTQTFTADACRLNARNSRDMVFKYCSPIAQVMNNVLLDQQLRLDISVHARDPGTTCRSTVSLIARYCGASQISSSTMLAKTDVLLNKKDPQRSLPASISSPVPHFLRTQTAALVTVAFLPRGSLRRGIFAIGMGDYSFSCEDPCVTEAVAFLVSCQSAGTFFGILTDEINTYTIDLRLDVTYRTDKVPLLEDFKDKIPLSIIIANCAYRAASCYHVVRGRRTGWLERSGALNSDPAGYWYSKSEPPAFPRWISDFDMYSVVEDPDLAEIFHTWRERVQANGIANPLLVSTELSFTPFQSCNRKFPLRPVYDRHDLPDETVNFFRNKPRRPRNAALDSILTSSTPVSFTITELVRTGKNHFSQVAFGKVTGCDETFCVKLYDERLFPLHGDSGYSFITPRDSSEEFLRREECVYDRLSDMQGLLLPHYYGSHLFNLPGGWQCYGLLLEKITGAVLGRLLRYLQPVPRDLQVSLVKQMRHAVRVLRAAGISQADWHESQALCIPAKGDFHLVLIDFALVDLDLGDEGGTPARPDLEGALGVFLMLVDDEVIDDPEIWLPALEYEY